MMQCDDISKMKLVAKLTNRIRTLRINAMALPKQRIDVVAKMERTLPPPISHSTLYGDFSKRVLRLAKPKKRQLYSESLRKRSSSRKKVHFEQARLLKLSEPKPLIRHVHEQCVDIDKETIYFKPTVRLPSVNSYIKQQFWLKNNSGPKRIFRPPVEPKKYTKMSKYQTQELYKRLSMVPISKQKTKKSDIHEKPPPKKEMLTETILQSIQRLSEPRKLSSETRLNLEFDPYFIPPAVLKHVATSRTIVLAEPRVYETTGTPNNFRDVAVEISKAALNYKATKRIKQLAMPRNYSN